MSEKQFDFSIRMDKENSTPELEPFDITVTPDTKGPKSVAILMFFGGSYYVRVYECDPVFTNHT